MSFHEWAQLLAMARAVGALSVAVLPVLLLLLLLLLQGKDQSGLLAEEGVGPASLLRKRECSTGGPRPISG